MTTTDDDLRAIDHLVQSIRADLKLSRWDEQGVRSVLTSLRHLPIAELAHRAIGHAADPEARTPGSLKRPFTPTVAVEATPRNPKAGEGCEVCGRWPHQCTCTDDDGNRAAPTRRRVQGKPPDPGLAAHMRSAIRAARTNPDPGTSPGSSHSKEET